MFKFIKEFQNYYDLYKSNINKTYNSFFNKKEEEIAKFKLMFVFNIFILIIKILGLIAFISFCILLIIEIINSGGIRLFFKGIIEWIMKE